jgi:protein-L-isoaspartate(D-aspartate) O-methyltransferase
MSIAVEDAHHRLIDQLIAVGALWSQPLIAAFRATPRHCFLDRVFNFQRQRGTWRELRTQPPGKTELGLIYSDRVLATRLSEDGGAGSGVPISSSSQPSLMAQMLEDLQLRPGLRFLEIGSGTGYNAALVAHVIGSLVSIEVDRRILAEAEAHVRGFTGRRVAFHHADGRLGYPPAAPYDRLLVTAAARDLESAWLDQLASGGLLLAPLTLAPGLSYLVCGQVCDGTFQGGLTRPAYFMPLRGEDPCLGGDTAQEHHLPAPQALSAVPAPWADWLDRKQAGALPGPQHSLAFLAWLSGLTVNYQTLPDGKPGYGIGDGREGQTCWLGTRQWHVSGRPGRDLGLRLWRTFLEAGGPRPGEFQLHSCPGGKQAGTFPPEPPGSLLTFHHVGLNCNHTWSLSEPRQRPAL